MELSQGEKGNGVECATFFRCHKMTTGSQTLCHKPNMLFLSTYLRQQNTFFWTNCDKATETVVQIIIVKLED